MAYGNLAQKWNRLINYRVLSVVAGLFAVIFPIVSYPASIAALSQESLDSIYKDTVWYKAESCISGNVTPGTGAPNGAQFPNLDPAIMASAINKWIAQENPRSTLKGLGATIVASAKNSNVNPFLIVTIARKESFMADPNDYNVRNGNNAFGRTATPSQPNFQGAKLWYKWTSVKASVDHTAPENRGTAGGGDIASYLRAQYASQINKNDFVALFLEYAPPGENDTVLYIAQIKSWLKELISLTAGQSLTIDGSLPAASNECTNAGVPAGNFVFYTQSDPRWANYAFGTSNLATSGCGPASVAMVVATLVNRSITPKEVADFGTRNGAYVPGQGSSWQKMLIEGPQNWGLKSEPIGTNMNRAVQILQSGGLVIATGQGLSPFSEGGHIVVIRAVNSDGSFLLGNPAPNLQNSRDQTFTPNQLLSAGLQTMFGVTK